IQLTGSEEFHREVFNLIKEFKAKSLDLGIHRVGNELLKEMMVDSYFHDLTKACEALRVNVQDNRITPEALQQMYKNMIEGSTMCRCLSIGARKDQCVSALKLIGVCYRDGTFFSNRDIEVNYQMYEWKDERYTIFDGCLEIVLGRHVFEDDYSSFAVAFHKTREELQKAKNREDFVRIKVSTE
ncbi:hypothetical protein PENTCL1PPCAC_19586, partial [Pristionchus entomophagus]